MSIPIFYDTHAHLTDQRFEADLGEVIGRARASGIERIICVGVDAESSRRAIELSERYAGVYATVGWHPTHCLDAPEHVGVMLRDLVGHEKVVAVGETGLDYFHQAPAGVTEEGYRAKQVWLFREQLELAAAAGLNVVVHHRSAIEDCLGLMAEYAGRVRGQFHCFEDGSDWAARVLAQGSLVSFTGLLTYKNKGVAREALSRLPLGGFMLETDSPYLAPEPRRREVSRCEPAFVRTTAEAAAGVKGCTVAELGEATCGAARVFFRKMK